MITRNTTKYVIVTDEKWIYCRELAQKEIQRFWVDNASDRPRIARRTIVDKKSMCLMASNIKEQFYYKILEDEETVNGDRYLAFLKAMFEYMTSMLSVPRYRLCIIHDNVRPHISKIVKNWVVENKITLKTQPPYSPDVNPSGLFYFSKFRNISNRKTS